ncbi:PAS domain S-box protein [Flavisphingomonas formosensis]|uniref:PAS domain S-box protein n=1 Tax=Flavisphingomonas formosensis TaxID=861534 RepID=UPI0012FC74C1|nr:PAS domain S-box protein [Sphingomonas formosensis]
MAGQEEFARRQRVLSEFGDFVLDGDDLDEILNEACRLIARALDVDLAKVVEIERHTGMGFIRAGVGWSPGIVGQERISLSERSSEAYAIEKTEPVITNDIRHEERFEFPRFLVDHGVVAMVNVPILLPGRVPFGVLQVDARSPQKFDQEDIEFLKTYSMVLGPVIDRWKTAAALKETDERLRLIVDNARAYVLVVSNADDRITDWLGGSEDILGWSSSEAMGVTTDMIFTPEDRATGVPDRELSGARERGTFPNVRWHQRKDGTRVFLDGQTIALKDKAGSLRGYLKIGQDVTERVRTEAVLRESEERLRQFGEASRDILWMRDAETLQWRYLTPAFEAVYGMGRDEALTGDNFRTWLDLILPEDREHAGRATYRVREGEQVTFDYRIRRPIDGTIRWLRDTDFPITDASGKVVLIAGVGHDLTELREAELRLQVLMEGIPQLVWRAVGKGDWTWSSPQWSEHTGLAAEYSVGWGWLEAFHPDDRDAARHAWEVASERRSFEIEARICHAATREYRWFQTRAAPVLDDRGTIAEWLGTSTDIHDIRELQERQRVLVAELQHRTRNMMGVVRSMSDKTARASADLPDFHDRFRDRLDALARVQGLLSRLNEHDRVTFGELIKTELAALDGAADRVSLDGPEGVRLRSSTVQTLAMALHELATNAVKYGALGQPNGRLRIEWRLEQRNGAADSPWLHIDWRESGVTMPSAGSTPRGGGQGRELIERALPYQLKARTTFELGQDGAHCTISLPVSATRNVEEEEHG